MTKLKTLKDMDFEGEHEGWDFSGTGRELLANKSGYGCAMRIVKQEAIKWIKEFDNKEKSSIFADISDIAIIAQKRWIKHFFNITDEDLK